MRPRWRDTLILALAAVLQGGQCSLSAAEPASSPLEVPLTPPEPLESFATIIRYEEGNATEPEDLARFEKFAAGAVKAGYNTIACRFRAERLAIGKRSGVKLMLDAAPPDRMGWDVRQGDQREKLSELVASFGGDKTIWGYSLGNLPPSNENARKVTIDTLALLRTADPGHPVWLAASDFRDLHEAPGTIGMLAWDASKGPWDAEKHWKMLAAGAALAHERIDPLGVKLALDSDARTTRFRVNTAIAFGVKGILWSDAPAVDPKTGAVDEKHGHVILQRELRPLYRDIAEIDRPQGTYSTPTTRTWDDREKPKDIPASLTPFPNRFWAEVARGEVLVGCFKYDEGFEALFVANHNSRREQTVTIQVRRSGAEAPSVERLDRENGKWKPLPLTGDAFSLQLAPGGGELIRLLHVASD